jgi:hypothetical protein
VSLLNNTPLLFFEICETESIELGLERKRRRDDGMDGERKGKGWGKVMAMGIGLGMRRGCADGDVVIGSFRRLRNRCTATRICGLGDLDFKRVGGWLRNGTK